MNRKNATLAFPALLMALAISACGTGSTDQPETSSGDKLRITMLDPKVPESSLPAGCSFREVQDIFDEFLDGGNSRNRSELVRRVSAQPELNEFGVDGAGPNGRYRLLKSPGAVYRFFAGQSRLGYTRRLRSGEVLPISPTTNRTSPFRRPSRGPAADDPVVSIGFGLDLLKDGRFLFPKPGKGGINCRTGQIYVYNGG